LHFRGTIKNKGLILSAFFGYSILLYGFLP
jgi:hypothetical protein